jgi:hypothetical protein
MMLTRFVTVAYPAWDRSGQSCYQGSTTWPLTLLSFRSRTDIVAAIELNRIDEMTV